MSHAIPTDDEIVTAYRRSIELGHAVEITPEWLAQRRAELHADRATCQHCGTAIEQIPNTDIWRSTTGRHSRSICDGPNWNLRAPNFQHAPATRHA